VNAAISLSVAAKTIGPTGWAAIGRQYGVWYFWGLFIGIIAVLVAWALFVLWVFGILQPLQTILKYVFYALVIISLLLLLGTTIYVGWKFIFDLGHNFYVNWKTKGAGAAGRGLVSEIKSCGRAMLKSFGNAIKKRAAPYIDFLRKKFGF